MKPLNNRACLELGLRFLQAEEMQGVGGDAAEISGLILDLARSLKVQEDQNSAATSLRVHPQPA